MKTSIRTMSVAAALMCGAMALPAAAASVGAGANGTAGMNTTAENTRTNAAATTAASGSIGTPATTAGVNGGINPAATDNQRAAGQQANSQTAMNDRMNMPAAAQASATPSAGQSDTLAMNESAIREVGGDTSKPFSASQLKADNQSEADITAQLNQKEAQMASSANSKAELR